MLLHNGIVELPEAPERQKLSVRDPARKKLILDTKRENPSMKAKEIARIADCKPYYVRKVLNDQVAKRPKPVKANLRKPAPPGPPVPEAGHGAQAEPGAASNPKWFERSVANSLPGLDPLLERLRRGEESPELRTDLLDPSGSSHFFSENRKVFEIFSENPKNFRIFREFFGFSQNEIFLLRRQRD